MKVKVLFFGSLGEVAGREELELNDIPDTDHLLSRLRGLYPALTQHTFRLAVNQTIVEGAALLNDNDEVALMPPFAGG